ncbi:MAG TPA: ABC transporter substrate-binding protein [Acidimicrobiales bacterium]|nr:ABC transporter substrate-binding protein [Acidimicrobiales bacterium]
MGADGYGTGARRSAPLSAPCGVQGEAPASAPGGAPASAQVSSAPLRRRAVLRGGLLAAAGALLPLRPPAWRGPGSTRAAAAVRGRRAEASAAPAPGLVRVGTMATTPSLDPLRGEGGSAVAAVFDALTTISPGEHLVGAGLASSWRLLSPTVAELVIDDAAVFADGSAVRASDAAFSLLTALSAPSPLGELLSGLSSVEAVSPLQLRVTTATADPLLPRRLAAVPVVSEAAYTSVGSGDAPQLVGSGYYEMGSFTPGSSYQLYASSRSWKGPPATAGVRVEEAVTEDELLDGLSAGGLDVAEDLPLAALDSLAGRLPLEWSPPGSIVCIVLDSSSPPFGDRRVRRAANLSIDAGRLASGVFGGAATVLAGQLAVPGCVGYDPALAAIEPDVTTARRLLGEAGFDAGLETVLAGPASGSAVLTAIAAQLAEGGFRVALELLDTTAWAGALRSPARYPMLLAELELAPLYDIGPSYALLSGAGGGSPGTFGGAAFARLQREQAVELDPARRAGLLAEMAALVHDELPVVPLVEQQWLYGLATGVSGLTTLGPTMELARLAIPPPAGAS